MFNFILYVICIIMIANSYVWNHYIPQQYIWDGTCGYHALTNGCHFIKMLSKCDKKIFEEVDFECLQQALLVSKEFDEINNTNVYELSNMNLMALNNGKKETYMGDLKYVNELNDYYSCKKNIYFFNKTDDLEYIKNVVFECKNGIYSIIIFYDKWWVKHWFSIVLQIENHTMFVHLLDNYSIVWQNDEILLNALRELNIVPLWHNVKEYKSHNAHIIIYKLWQSFIFFISYFVIIYGVVRVVKK